MLRVVNAAGAIRAVAALVPVAMMAISVAVAVSSSHPSIGFGARAAFELVATVGLGCMIGALPVALWILTGMKILNAWADRVEKRAKERPIEF